MNKISHKDILCNRTEYSQYLTITMNGVCVCVLLAQLCPTLCDPTDCSLPGSSVHGILQARTLEWVAMISSRGSSQPRDQTQVSHTAGRLQSEPPRKPHEWTITFKKCELFYHTSVTSVILSINYASIKTQVPWRK